MNIVWQEGEEHFAEMEKVFNEIPQDQSLFMSHHELATVTPYTAAQWKEYILHPRVAEEMQEELQLYKHFQLKKMIKTATADNRNVGAAQMMNALSKQLEEDDMKKGPIFIYSSTPLNTAETIAAQMTGHTTVTPQPAEETVETEESYSEISRVNAADLFRFGDD